MKSHTVPKRLLKQFAYNDPSTKPLRLWEYRKGQKPYGFATPKTATRIDGFFANPDDAQFEATVETRLNVEIEEPVNRFMSNISDPTFAATDQPGQSGPFMPYRPTPPAPPKEGVHERYPGTGGDKSGLLDRGFEITIADELRRSTLRLRRTRAGPVEVQA